MPQLGYCNIREEQVSTKSLDSLDSGVNIIIGIVGALRGNVIFSIGPQTAKAIASTMMGIAVDELDDMAKSALSELANMLTATAVTTFYSMGKPIDISTPTLLESEKLSIKLNANQILFLRFCADENAIEICLAIEN